jgi:hypothetical protein
MAVEAPMIPGSFLKTATDEDRQVLQKWNRGIVMVYSILALALVAFCFVTSGRKDAVDAKNEPAQRQAGSSLRR